MEEKEINEKLRELEKKLPKLPDGRIDYTKSETCLVLTVFIIYNDKMLLLKRSEKVGTYKNKWNTVTGYIDEKKPIYLKILDEIKEELGITKNNILSYNLYESFEFKDKTINKKWIIYPSKIELINNPKIKLDWEHSEFRWINSKDLLKYDIVPKLDLSLNKVINNKY